jgi:hypothetical protein
MDSRILGSWSTTGIVDFSTRCHQKELLIGELLLDLFSLIASCGL